MFTGIVEELGTVRALNRSTTAMELTIEASKVLEDVKLGDSIAVNGICLTVKQFTESAFLADVMPETVNATGLSMLKKGSRVNLERAMPANGRFGGHIVSGHIDGVAKIVKKKTVANAVYIDLEMSSELLSQCIEKGSITVDGTSLTIFNIASSTLTISLIPHTYSQTVLGEKQQGEIVNIEIDLIGKYVARHLLNQSKEAKVKDKLSLEVLQRAGF